ncbi:chloramphenicol phosphotransferase CPT family protein [Mycobacterium sp. shizuoka-1]|uniref:chloramphenicol phosphotransferase CPT family protein n=1 Tax=Mycobacterium sp. shizuoka-1 TaxID=2039281 RepID=UPI0018EB3080|nr:AAA family ATPase [Mycobacterium sp. shizuoka-1]
MAEPPAPGQVILLNGVTSSGKSTIARQLLADFPSPWFHMSVDMFGAMRSEARTHELDADALSAVLRRTRAGFHRAVAGMAMAGNDIVMDHVLSEPWRLADLLTVTVGIDVVCVGVHCDRGELERREAARGDRVPGSAVDQLARVHAHATYDVEVDTSIESVEECSARIRGYLLRHPPPAVRAFDTLRGVADSGDGTVTS